MSVSPIAVGAALGRRRRGKASAPCSNMKSALIRRRCQRPLRTVERLGKSGCNWSERNRRSRTSRSNRLDLIERRVHAVRRGTLPQPLPRRMRRAVRMSLQRRRVHGEGLPCPLYNGERHELPVWSPRRSREGTTATSLGHFERLGVAGKARGDRINTGHVVVRSGETGIPVCHCEPLGLASPARRKAPRSNPASRVWIAASLRSSQ